MSYYVLLRKLSVRQANALSSNYAVNAAPIMAINLFAHALALKTHNTALGVAIIHHDAQLLGERDDGFKRFAPQQRRAATYINSHDYAGGTQTLSLQPTVAAHLELSLVIEVKRRPDLDDLNRFLRFARIAGGTIQHIDEVGVFDDSDEQFDAALPKTGFWLVERSDLLTGHENPVTALIQALGKRPLPASAPEAEKKEPSWLVPTVLGYGATTDFEARTGVRMLDDGTFPAHAFAEPLLGLAQYVSLRDRDDPALPFWRTAWVSEDVFVTRCDA